MFDLIENKLNPKTHFRNTFFKHFFNQKGVLRNEGLSSTAVLLNAVPLNTVLLNTCLKKSLKNPIYSLVFYLKKCLDTFYKH